MSLFLWRNGYTDHPLNLISKHWMEREERRRITVHRHGEVTQLVHSFITTDTFIPQLDIFRVKASRHRNEKYLLLILHLHTHQSQAMMLF
jgi:hypothetical protein